MATKTVSIRMDEDLYKEFSEFADRVYMNNRAMMRSYYLRWIAAAIGVVAVLVLAMCLSQPNDTGTVTGFVYERSGLNPDPRPVGGTTVTATPLGNTREMESAMTASNGSYFFRLLPGTYELAAKADWYGLEGTPVPVVVTAGESTTFDFTFTAP